MCRPREKSDSTSRSRQQQPAAAAAAVQQSSPRMAPQELSVFRIPPYHYIHVLDQTTNVTRLEVGPATFVRKDNETVVSGPQRMVTVPPRHYCVVLNPVMRDQDGQILLDAVGQVSYC